MYFGSKFLLLMNSELTEYEEIFRNWSVHDKSEAGKHSQFVKNITCSVQIIALIHDMLLVFYI